MVFFYKFWRIFFFKSNHQENLKNIIWKKFDKKVFLGSWDFKFNFFNYLKYALEYINPSGRFVFYEIFCSSNVYEPFYKVEYLCYL